MGDPSNKASETIARKFFRVCQDHEETPAELVTAFVWTASTLANWFGMTTEQFLATFEETFRIAQVAGVPGFSQPTIIGGGLKS